MGSEERVVSYKKACLFFGRQQPVVQTCNIFREWSRTRILKKNGSVTYSDWKPSPTPLEGAGASLLMSVNNFSSCCPSNGLSWAGGNSVHSTTQPPLNSVSHGKSNDTWR